MLWREKGGRRNQNSQRKKLPAELKESHESDLSKKWERSLNIETIKKGETEKVRAGERASKSEYAGVWVGGGVQDILKRKVLNSKPQSRGVGGQGDERTRPKVKKILKDTSREKEWGWEGNPPSLDQVWAHRSRTAKVIGRREVKRKL